VTYSLGSSFRGMFRRIVLGGNAGLHAAQLTVSASRGLIGTKSNQRASAKPNQGSLFDGDSVTFPLEWRSVQVLVSESAKDSSKEIEGNPLFRHTPVKRFYDESTRHVATQVAVPGNSLPLLFGEAGAGKTMCGVSVAAYLDPAGACLRLRCTAEIFVIDPAELLGRDPTRMPLLSRWSSQFPKKRFSIDDFEATYGQPAASWCPKERDLVAQQFVLRAMDEVIKENNRHPSVAVGHPPAVRTLVVFLDDAGQCPTFVRAMCSCFYVLQWAISKRFSGGMCPVRIIMAGTNMQGEDHRAGSEAKTYWSYHVRSNAWSVLVTQLPDGMQQLLTDDRITLVRIVNGMCLNARVAANFVNEVERLATPDHNLVALEPAMRDAAALAANAYKMASNRRELSAAADLDVVLRAIAQQTWKTEVHSGPHSLAKYGMLVDRAASLVIAQADMRRYEQLDGPKGSVAKALFLHRAYLGVRYELSVAQIMMLQVALRIADLSKASEGFEKAAADFTAVAMELSRRDIKMNFDFFRTAPPPWKMPNGWSAPLLLAERISRSTPRTKSSAPPQTDVHRILSTMKLQPWGVSLKKATLEQYLQKHILPKGSRSKRAVLPTTGTVIVNGAGAEYADVIAFVGTDELLLVNAKSHTAKGLAPKQLFRELYKMGHRDWRSVLAHWRDEGDDNPPAHMLSYLSSTGVAKRKARGEARGDEKTKTFDKCVEDATEETKKWLMESKYGKASNELTDLLRRGTKHVTYVIMVYGVPPTSLPVIVPETWPAAENAAAAAGNAPIPIDAAFSPIPPSLRAELQLLLAEEHEPQQSDEVERAREAVHTAAADILPQKLREAMRKVPGRPQSEPLSDDQRSFLRDLRHDFSVPADVLLLFSPSPSHTGRGYTSPDSVEFAAEQLWGYYPIVVNPPSKPVHLDAIRRQG
jgi:hypothetical protein